VPTHVKLSLEFVIIWDPVKPTPCRRHGDILIDWSTGVELGDGNGNGNGNAVKGGAATSGISAGKRAGKDHSTAKYIM